MFDSTTDPDPEAHGPRPADRVRVALAEWAAEDRDGWSGAALSAEMVEFAEFEESVRAARIGLTATWDGRMAWAEGGACSPVAWLAHHTPESKARAARLVRCARLVRVRERTAKALAAGDVTSGHVEVLADAARHREDLFEAHEDVLVDAAATLAVDDFAKIATTWRLYADDVRTNAEVWASVEHASFDARSTFRGRLAVNAMFDGEGGAIVLAALDARCRPDPRVEGLAPRSLSERRATALIEMASESLQRGAKGGRVPVGIDVVVDVATLRGDPLGDLTAVRCELRGVGPISPETARRLACDAAIGRVVMNGRAEVLDLGQRTRVVSPAQHRALAHRDGGCVFPGCDRPHEWCDGHHLIPWERGGPTDLDNLALLCRRHHVAVHEGHWKLGRDPATGVWATEAPP